MKRNYKTSNKKRTTYIYYSADGTKIEIVPGENQVTEVDIELLHAMDDSEVNEKRRDDYRVTTHLDGYCNGENNIDHNKYLSDNSANPESIFIQHEEKQELEHKLHKLKLAMENLLPQQKDLLEKKYIKNRTNTDIATEENVSEVAIRNRLKKIHEKIKKSLA